MNVDKRWFSPKMHLVVLVVTVITEAIGVKKFTLGPGTVLLLPMLYALILTGMMTVRPFKFFTNEESNTASPLITISILFLVAKIGVTIGPNIETIIQAGPALLLQELGNLGTICLGIPIAVLLGLKREAIGAAHSIAREPNVAIIAEKYGLDSPEGRGVLGVYVVGTLFGAVFMGLLAGFLATTTPLHPYALAMACGVGSGSMMAASSGSLVAALPALKEQIVAFAGASNLATMADGVYATIFLALPLSERLYSFMYKILHQNEDTSASGEVSGK